MASGWTIKAVDISVPEASAYANGIEDLYNGTLDVIVLRGSGDERTLASLAAVSGDVRQVESVVRDLLEVARPGEVTRTSGDLNALVSRCLAQVADRLAYRNIH